MSEIETISGVADKKIEDQKNKIQRMIETMDRTGREIKHIEQDDKTLVNEAPEVIASLDESLNANVHQGMVDHLDKTPREVQRVKSVEGKQGGEHSGGTEGYTGKWELVKSIDISSIVDKSYVRGLISDDEIVLDSSNNALYVTNISSEYTENVIEGDYMMHVTSCVPLDSNVIVCGKEIIVCRSDSLDGCIALYDRQWKLIRDFTIPRNIYSYSTVYVDVDQDDMILAALRGQSNIHVINPADGKIVNTFMMQGKKVWGRIQALSSGDIVVKTGGEELTVISRLGEEKVVIHRNEWGVLRCFVDKLTDTLYISYMDEERDMYAVDQVLCDGNTQTRRIVEYQKSVHSSYIGQCLVTPSGHLVACNGEELFVYKKTFLE